MKPSLTDTLCTQCGLCCDGSLFADVELVGRAEATRLEIMGLEIDDDADGELLLLPCAALQGTRCSVYAHRPKCCRSFECHLLQEARRGAVTVERATEQIAEARKRIGGVKDLLAQLGQPDARLSLKERCAEALRGEPSAIPGVNRKRAELEAAMSSVERLILKTFLGVAGEGRSSRLRRRARP
jgi:Fe-S-cluster containining protein